VDAEPTLTRRTLLVAAAGTAGAAALAGCAKSSKGGASAATTAAAAPIAKLSDVAVGESISAAVGSKPILIAQPTAGKVVAFSAICTHQGCTVAPAGKQFHCPCHGSVYDAATGAVITGPAPLPLPPFAVHVAGGEILAGA
jgi:cytochrome b6-f complex iron-sulfur subunit